MEKNAFSIERFNTLKHSVKSEIIPGSRGLRIHKAAANVQTQKIINLCLGCKNVNTTVVIEKDVQTV